MADLSQLSTEELMRMRGAPAPAPASGGVDLSKVSTEDLMKMHGSDNPVIRGIEAYGNTARNVGMGMIKGASDIGSTLLRPVDAALNATGLTDTTNAQRRASLGGFFKENADPSSLAFKGGELSADIAGTAGVGGAMAKGVQAAGGALPALAQYAPKLAAALESGGFSLGTPAATTVAGRLADAATRVLGGAAVGGASAGLIDPKNAATGAVIGGALPAAVQVAGMAGKALSAKVAPEVADLYEKAKSLGIDVPADRLVNSRPLNAAASSLNYIPMSGRAATEEKMVSQLNRAVSRTFGQDSDNVTAALRKAGTDLGDKFEVTLKSNTVKVDEEFLNDMVSNMTKAAQELSPQDAKIIGNQVDAILAKAGPSGELEGQAAYNIKKTLDRIGQRSSNDAFYARDLKKSLMGALNRSLGSDEAAAFATVRKQYGNMLDLEGLAQNGAEGGISVGRLANLKNIGNPELQDLADISAQFIRSRESPHGAAQRVVLGGLGLGSAAAAPAAIPAIIGGMAAARAANTALNSTAIKNLLMAPPRMAQGMNALGSDPAIRSLIYNAANRSSP